MSACGGCSAEEHDLLRGDVSYFLNETTNHVKWNGLLLGTCSMCASTLALACCCLCTEPTPSGDSVPWGDPTEDRRAHAICATRAALKFEQEAEKTDVPFLRVLSGGRT